MGLSGRVRPVLLVVLLLAVLLLAPASPLVERTPQEDKTVEDVRLVKPVENGSTHLWPYTSRGKSFRQATLPFNAVVYADATTVYRLLAASPEEQRGLYWNESERRWVAGESGQGNVTINGTGLHWGKSAGSTRYTFLMTEEGMEWKSSTYQVHDGPYFGARHHLRLYEGGSGEHTWTAIQAHHEHWDWFQLRHDVSSLSRTRNHLERDFRGTGLVSDMRRERWGNGGAIDADGWVTAIELRERVVMGPETDLDPRPSPDPSALAVSLSGLLLAAYLEEVVDRAGDGIDDVRKWVDRVRESRVNRYTVALFASTALLPLVVRIGAIAAERTFPRASVVAIGAPFYLLLVLGLPACAVGFGRHVPATDGFSVCVVGLATGIMADYAYLGLAVVPYWPMVQRLVLLFGLGLVGAGGSRWATGSVPRHRYHLVGLAIWVAALLWPLLA